MFLILSAAYIDQELCSEFGHIPPSFLPLGNKRLYQRQIELVPRNEAVSIALPKGFSLPEYDKYWLEKNNVSLMFLHPKLTLGQAFSKAIRTLKNNTRGGSLSVLFGDTLFDKLPGGDDIALVSENAENYGWSYFGNNENRWIHNSLPLEAEETKTICGFFRFSSLNNLISAISPEDEEFMKTLNNYKRKFNLEPIYVDDWFDFGHITTFHRSKAKITTQRQFNVLVINDRYIEKSSNDKRKIKAEAEWFENIPEMVRLHTPQYLGTGTLNGKFSYKLEYMHLSSLNELFVYGRLPVKYWKRIIDKCLDFLSECIHYDVNEYAKNTFDELLFDKTNSRINMFVGDYNSDFDFNKKWAFKDENPISLKDILLDAGEFINKGDDHIGIMHGDFCFSNILYDFRSNTIKLIDPRGLTPSGKPSIYGDIRYDLAKLSHSILGCYDHLIAGQFDSGIIDDKLSITFYLAKEIADIQEYFYSAVAEKFSISLESLFAMQIHLFLSMIPLHKDSKAKQDAIFANVYRIYFLMKACES